MKNRQFLISFLIKAVVLTLAVAPTGAVVLDNGAPSPAKLPQNPERRLLKSTDLLRIFQAHVPKEYQIISATEKTLSCRHKTRPAMVFYIKLKEKPPAEGTFIPLFSITLTNTPAMTAQTVSSFNAFYRLIIPADALEVSVVEKAQQIFQINAKVDSKFTFFTDLEKYTPLTMQEIFKTAQIQSLLTELIKDRTIDMTNYGLLAEGNCAGHADMVCRIQIYRIANNLGGIVIWLSGRTMNFAFPLGNFEENFNILKPKLMKELAELYEKQTPESKPNQSFGSFVTTLGESLDEICPNCHTKKELGPGESESRLFWNSFAVEKKVLVPAKGETPAATETESVNSIFVAFYNSWDRFQFSHATFDNARVRKELILPLHQVEMKKRLTEEGKSFVLLSQGDFENENVEVIIGVADVKAVFEELKESCDGGAVVEVPGKGFIFKCGNLPVVKVSEVNNDFESCIKIDFLVLKGKDEAAAIGTGFVLSKASLFAALPKIKPDLQAYLEGFKNGAGGE